MSLLRHLANQDFGRPVEFNMLEIAALVLRLVDGTLRIDFWEPRPSGPRQRQLDIGRGRATLGRNATVKLVDGLTETIASFGGRIAL